MSAVASQIAAFAAVVLALLGGYFLVRILVLVLAGEIDLLANRPGSLADLAEQVIYLLVTIALAVNAQAIGRAFAGLAQANQSALLSGDLTRLSVLIDPAVHLLTTITINLVVALTLMAVVLIALRGQVANLLSSAEGLSRSILQVIAALAVLALGVIALVVGRSLLMH